MFKYYRMAMKEAKKQKELDKKKARLLAKDMDYQFLEEIVQKVNENPHLTVKITLKDHTELVVNTTPARRNNYVGGSESDIDFMEVK
jgi:hypothetical protein